MKLHYSVGALFGIGFITINSIQAQEYGTLTGDIHLNANFFQRDTSIGASDNPLYDNLLSGSESWMTARYNIDGFTAFARIDVFNNSNLKNPVVGMSGFGLGAWSLSKEFNKLTVTGGYIYDQIGSGILFRAYENRGLLIDNALAGLHLKYNLRDNIRIKAFTGQQKNVFERYNPIIKGANLEADFNVKDKAYFAPGIGVLNRTLDKGSMDVIVNTINGMPLDSRFVPQYNTYAFTAYNNLNVGNFNWYIEGAYKTKEAINDYNGNLINRDGNVLFSTINYTKGRVGLSLMGKRTENFILRTSPSQTEANSGMLNWQPIIAYIRPQRLIARYMPASQDLSEMAMNATLNASPTDDLDFTASYTHINTLEGLKLYREVFAEANIRSIPRTTIDIGAQYLHYNQEFYQFKPGVPMFKSFTPYTEITYSFTDLKSGKLQLQYMDSKQDYGSWLFVALEYSIASKISFAISDMYNIAPAKAGTDKKHYYNFFVAFTEGAHRLSLAYVKQVEGINCTGGVCRYEPAFNGLKLGLTSTF